MKNSCGKRGCDVRIILPHDRKPINVHSGMHEGRDDIKKILSLASLLAYKKKEDQVRLAA